MSEGGTTGRIGTLLAAVAFAVVVLCLCAVLVALTAATVLRILGAS